MTRAGYPAEYLSTRDVAELSSFSVKTIERAIRAGRLQASKVGRVWRISVTNYEAWIQATGEH